MKLNSVATITGYIRTDHMVLPVRDLHHLWGWDSITEATYSEIASLIDGNFLNQKIRADELQSANFLQFDNDIMQFTVPSSEFDTV